MDRSQRACTDVPGERSGRYPAPVRRAGTLQQLLSYCCCRSTSGWNQRISCSAPGDFGRRRGEARRGEARRGDEGYAVHPTAVHRHHAKAPALEVNLAHSAALPGCPNTKPPMVA